MRRLRAAELFAGGGGLAVGLRNAGFVTVAAVENEPHAAATFKANHKRARVFQKDVREVVGSEILALTDGKLDLLAACPPCQGFSALTSKWRRDDHRNRLVSEVARLAEETRPTVVMLENVPGLADKGALLFLELIRRLEAANYVCNWSVLQVADYGVPQRRRRLVLMAGLGFRIELPSASHSRNGDLALPRWLTVRDAISCMSDTPISWPKVREFGGPQSLNWHVTREMSRENKARLSHAKPGGIRMELPERVLPRCHQNSYDGFRNVYGRMRWDEPSSTITAGCLSLSKGRFGHPSEDRTISLREAALLQTFPPTYQFETMSIERATEIVGNALPCRFATALAKKVARAIRQERKSES